MKCENCNTELTKEKQEVGSRISSTKKNGPIYTTKCKNCGTKNPEKVKKLIQQ